MATHFDPKFGEIIDHKASGFHLDDVANELNITLDKIVKAILMEYKDKEPILCIVRSIDRIKTKNIKKLTGYKFSFMKEESLSKLHLSPGAIPPFIGFQLGIKTFVDENLQKDEFYYGSGGSVYNACKFSIKDYVFLGGIIKNLTKN